MTEEIEDRQSFYDQQSYILDRTSPGNIISFNVENGYFDALLRGFRSGFLNTANYRQLCQCENLEDVKLAMNETDFMGIFQGISKLTPDIIVDKCSQKFVEEFHHIKSQATGSLASFLDFLTYEYMLNNISFILSSLVKGGDPETLLAKCDPLGKFPYMRSILTFDRSEDGLRELYQTFLIDTPVGRYFEQFFRSTMGEGAHALDHVSQVFREEQIELVNDMVKKLWLEDFYNFTQSLGGETASMMKELLEFEADRRAISIMINSFNTHLNELNRRDDRQKLFANFGKLYPEGISKFKDVGDMNSLGMVLEKYYSFSDLFSRAERDSREVEELLYEKEVELNRYAFDGQSHFACYWGFVKLKEQEKRNIFWITECINQGLKDVDMINRWIPIF